jgi:hypothetical protein
MDANERRWPPRQPLLDMTPDGGFREPTISPLVARVFRLALIVAVIAGVIAAAALALWVALALIPIAIAAGVIAYAALRWQMWRAGRQRGSVGRERDLFRP